MYLRLDRRGLAGDGTNNEHVYMPDSEMQELVRMASTIGKIVESGKRRSASQ